MPVVVDGGGAVLVIFPEHPMRPGEVDPSFQEEIDAARGAGFEVRLYGEEALAAGDVTRAFRRLPEHTGATAELMFRGWMMRGELYSRFDAALSARGYRLLNDAEAYAQAHYLPLAYPLIEGHTPRSAWTDRPDIDEAWQVYQAFRPRDALVKDWVKSAKHRWHEACFIPAETAHARFGEILSTFVDERGRLFEHGFVLREFVPLLSDGTDMRGHPVDHEVRLFFLDGQIVVSPQPRFMPPPERIASFCALAKRFRSRFMSMDIAESASGDWLIIEVGDGGVSGLPVSLMADTFYSGVRRIVGRPNSGKG